MCYDPAVVQGKAAEKVINKNITAMHTAHKPLRLQSAKKLAKGSRSSSVAITAKWRPVMYTEKDLAW